MGLAVCEECVKHLYVLNKGHVPCLLCTQSRLALQESPHPPDGERGFGVKCTQEDG